MKPTTDPILLAYVAGLFDGEGSIVIGVSQPTPKNRRRTPGHWLQVGITNTDKELTDWLHENFGGHISSNSHSPSRKRQRPCWAWCVMSNQATGFLESIKPYLRYKKAQAEIAITFQGECSGQTNKRLTEETLQRREEHRTNLRKLTLGHHTLPPTA